MSDPMKPVASVYFHKDRTVEMAQFISELVRQGVTFRVDVCGDMKDSDGWQVNLTGGY